VKRWLQAQRHTSRKSRWSPPPLAQAACPDDRAIDCGAQRLLSAEYAC
jgi:hypothetical protein